MMPQTVSQRAAWGLAHLAAMLALAALVASVVFPRRARAQFLANPTLSVGAEVAYPEGPGLWVDFWPLTLLSLEARVTMANADGAAVMHVPIADATQWRHDLLARLSGGYEYDWVRLTGDATVGGRAGVQAGYGLLGDIDVRILAGAMWTHRVLMTGMHPDFTATLMVGKTWL